MGERPQQRESKTTLRGRLDVLSNLNKSIWKDGVLRDSLVGCGGLFRFLRLDNPQLLTPLAERFIDLYDASTSSFLINNHRIGITLQDVLFLCHLPITGKPLILTKCPSTEAYERVFGEKPDNKFSATSCALQKIVEDKNRSLEQRKIATLLVIIRNGIMPSAVTTMIPASYVEVLENLDGISEYAWGAALLSHLLNGLEKFKKGGGSFNGSIWCLLAFFFVRIPKLWGALKIDIESADRTTPLMHWVIKNLAPKCHNRKMNLAQVDQLLNNLDDEDIEWLPYKEFTLPVELLDNVSFVARVSPIFCNNFVAFHKPHLVAKQFGLDPDNYGDDEFSFLNINIKTIDNRGGQDHKYHDLFKDGIEIWNKQECLDLDYSLTLQQKLTAILRERRRVRIDMNEASGAQGSSSLDENEGSQNGTENAVLEELQGDPIPQQRGRKRKLKDTEPQGQPIPQETRPKRNCNAPKKLTYSTPICKKGKSKVQRRARKK